MTEKTTKRIALLALLAAGATACIVMAVSTTVWQDNPIGSELFGEDLERVIARNSPLTEYAYLSPHADFPRGDEIRKVTIHHMAGNGSLPGIGGLYQQDRNASANYAIDVNGRVGLYVEEKNAAWTSSSQANDSQAVTIEVANDETGGQWHVSDASFEALIDLVTDICFRNGIQELNYTGDASGNLTVHRMFKDTTECPGPYLYGRMPEIAELVNERLRQERAEAES